MDHLILVDSVQAVPADCTPELSRVGDVMLEKTAADALRKMLGAAAEDGVFVRAFSGYRPAEYQRVLFMQSVHNYLGEGMSEQEARALTARYVALPGHSEHQTGLACDLCPADADDADESFAQTPESAWLSRNAPRFGFILRYPRMKEHITGIAYEPWHYRYVGRRHAESCMSRGLTLEEYLYYYRFEQCLRG